MLEKKPGMANLRNNGSLRGQVKDVFGSQKGCRGEEVDHLFSEALEGSSEPVKGQKSWEADLG